MKKAIISGVTGQDGSYLAEYLLEMGYEVHGVVRRNSQENHGRLFSIESRTSFSGRFFCHYGDLSDPSSLIRIIDKVKPNEFYNLGAQSHVRVSFEIPEYTAEVTGRSTFSVLEAIRQVNPKIKFYQASSSEMFGAAPPPQNESTRFKPCSPYAIAKVMSYWATVNYRESYGMYACNGILFNHESPRRAGQFVTRKVTTLLARIFSGEVDCISMGNLYAKRDWGYAGDYVKAMHKMLNLDKPDDFVIGTGKTYTVKQFVEEAFQCAGISLAWKGEGVNEVGYIERLNLRFKCQRELKKGDILIKIDPYYFRPVEVDYLQADISKAKQVLGWSPSVSFQELVQMMVGHDMKKNGLLSDEKSGLVYGEKNIFESIGV